MRILYVTTISLTMNSFFKPHVEMLVREGNQVDIACNSSDLALDGLYDTLGCVFYQIDFSRSPLSPDNIRAYGQLKKVVEQGNYDIVHCHTPNAAVVTRLVCRKFRKKNGLKVFYTAHGFHFYKGAPKLNWLVYYPVEKNCSRFTDKLITINREDYELAKSKFRAGQVHYVPGVGVDLSRFENVQVDRAVKRKELGIPEDAILLIAVGELSDRKNHKVILQALSLIKRQDIYYIVVGKGERLPDLQNCAEMCGLQERVKFLGFRTDVAELYKTADICCFPSVHEGLPVAVMEAMACGVPTVCSSIRGNVDLIHEDAGFLVEPFDAEGFATAIERLVEDRKLMESFASINKNRVVEFGKDAVLKDMAAVYGIVH